MSRGKKPVLGLVENNSEVVNPPEPTQVIEIFNTEYRYNDEKEFVKSILVERFEKVIGYSVNADYLAVVLSDKTIIISKHKFDRIEVTK